MEERMMGRLYGPNFRKGLEKCGVKNGGKEIVRISRFMGGLSRMADLASAYLLGYGYTTAS
jgi:hypothetical protein